MALFKNSGPEDFLLFVCNFNMTRKMLGTLQAGANIQYCCMLVHGEVLRQFYMLSVDVENSTPLTWEDISLGLGTYIPPF